MKRLNRRRLKAGIATILTWVLALLYAFPIIYMLITGFKPEELVAPPRLAFTPTLENYDAVIKQELLRHSFNSVFITTATVLFTILLAVPAAYSIVFGSLKNADGIYFWFITTTLLPAVAVVIPIFLAFNYTGLLDTKIGLVLLYTGAGVPLMIWMVRTFFSDVPYEILEAADIDGCTRFTSFFRIILPLIKGGIFSTALLVFITTWNEFFFAVNMTYSKSATLPVYLNRFLTQQGYFWAKMSAASTLVVVIPVILGFFTQKTLVKGLTLGAVKG
jgi:sorbitol/mannitol transport system permease protein